MPAEAPRPTWVSARPVTGGYYVGIGLANKNRPDAQEAAKKNALNDLASEISVTVVPYKHLTRPTNRLRKISGGAATIKKKTKSTTTVRAHI